MRKRSSPPASVFLNIPYDTTFEPLYLAYIAGLSAFGLVPRATLEIPGSARRLERIFDLIKSCQYSIHDLSRVELDTTSPRTPRFNMPFELGLTVAWQNLHPKKHAWFVCETKARRVSKSLSDLDGTDVYIHHGRTDGIFRELCNAFVRSDRQPGIPEMRMVFADIKTELPALQRDNGARSIYEARMFKDICVVASASADKHLR